MSDSLLRRLLGDRPPSYESLLAQAEQPAPLFLPRIETGWIGSAVALAGLGVGLAWVRFDPSGSQQAWGWLALLLVFGGMGLQFGRRHIDTGWTIDWQARRITPVGATGQPVQIDGEGYAVVCTAGDKRRSVAIDLRHDERGRVARLFQTPGPARMADHRTLSALADVLSRRLGVGRGGLTI